MAKKEGKDGQSKLVGSMSFSEDSDTTTDSAKESKDDALEEEQSFVASAKTQAEIDLGVLAEAQTIRQNSARFRAAKSIAGDINIG